ncbi:MAG: hypothetical protein HY055_15175 [Magnetospirillum sp.]|nr:hypothetical protein [Magnetospirillum sp.]
MNTSLLELISDAIEAAKAGGIDRAIALDYAAKVIQQTDDGMPLSVARRIAQNLLPASNPHHMAA